MATILLVGVDLFFRGKLEGLLPAHRLVTSDVIWEDLFRDPTKKELANLNITGVNVPGSVFLANPDIGTTASMKSSFLSLVESSIATRSRTPWMMVS